MIKLALQGKILNNLVKKPNKLTLKYDWGDKVLGYLANWKFSTLCSEKYTTDKEGKKLLILLKFEKCISVCWIANLCLNYSSLTAILMGICFYH